MIYNYVRVVTGKFESGNCDIDLYCSAYFSHSTHSKNSSFFSK